MFLDIAYQCTFSISLNFWQQKREFIMSCLNLGCNFCHTHCTNHRDSHAYTYIYYKQNTRHIRIFILVKKYSNSAKMPQCCQTRSSSAGLKESRSSAISSCCQQFPSHARLLEYICPEMLSWGHSHTPLSCQQVPMSTSEDDELQERMTPPRKPMKYRFVSTMDKLVTIMLKMISSKNIGTLFNSNVQAILPRKSNL